jgi:hypothetical protein
MRQYDLAVARPTMNRVNGAAPVTTATAARAFGKSPATIRRWILQGAPCARRGESGRGRGALLDLEQVRAWRAARAGIADVKHGADLNDTLNRIAKGLWRAFKRGTRGESEPTWSRLGDKSSRAAIMYADAFLSIVFELTGTEPSPETLPAEIQTLQKCAVLVLLARTSALRR